MELREKILAVSVPILRDEIDDAGLAEWAAVAKWGALINLFNLIPLYPLDGGRAFRVLSKNGRWLAVLVIDGAWAYATWDLLSLYLVLMLLVAVLGAAGGRTPAEPDRWSLVGYLGLVAAFTVLAQIEAPLPQGFARG